MKSFLIKTLYLVYLLGGTTACNDLTLGPEPVNTPEANYEMLWQEFDRMYGQFEAKSIDWNAIYKKYRPQVCLLYTSPSPRD